MTNKRKIKLTIINRSKWSDGFVNILCPWICKRAGIDFEYEITLKSTQHKGTWNGIGARHWQTVRCHRRVVHGNGAVTSKDSRFQWSKQYHWTGPVETLVFLLAHEAWHATGGGPWKFRNQRTGRTDCASMEYRCNKFGMEAIEAFRAEWPAMKLRVVLELRRLTMRKNVAAANKVAKRGPDAKLMQAQKNLANWQRKLKFAANKVKAHESKVKLFNRRVRAAAAIKANPQPRKPRPASANPRTMKQLKADHRIEDVWQEYNFDERQTWIDFADGWRSAEGLASACCYSVKEACDECATAVKFDPLVHSA